MNIILSEKDAYFVHYAGNITKKEQEDAVIGKKLLDQSILVSNIEDILEFKDIVGK